LIKLFRAKGQELILFQVKGSVKRIWESVMSRSGITDCLFCANETELEDVLQSKDENKCHNSSEKYRYYVVDWLWSLFIEVRKAELLKAELTSVVDIDNNVPNT
jgi:hypothetical protein